MAPLAHGRPCGLRTCARPDRGVGLSGGRSGVAPDHRAADSRHDPGRWVWAELFTEDVKAAERFYGKAFDWSFQLFPSARGPGYTLALSGGEPVGGMLQRDHTQQKERGSRWLGMISVADVKAAGALCSGPWRQGCHAAAGSFGPGRGRAPCGSGGRAVRRDPSAAGDPADYLAEDRQGRGSSCGRRIPGPWRSSTAAWPATRSHRWSSATDAWVISLHQGRMRCGCHPVARADADPGLAALPAGGGREGSDDAGPAGGRAGCRRARSCDPGGPRRADRGSGRRAPRSGRGQGGRRKMTRGTTRVILRVAFALPRGSSSCRGRRLCGRRQRFRQRGLQLWRLLRQRVGPRFVVRRWAGLRGPAEQLTPGGCATAGWTAARNPASGGRAATAPQPADRAPDAATASHACRAPKVAARRSVASKRGAGLTRF